MTDSPSSRARAEVAQAFAEGARARAEQAADGLQDRAAWLQRTSRSLPQRGSTRAAMARRERLGTRLAIEGETITIALSGELDLASVGVLEECFAVVAHFAPARVVVDLRGLAFVESCGLNALAEFRDQIAGRAELALVRGPAHVDRAFAAAGVAELFEFVHDSS